MKKPIDQLRQDIVFSDQMNGRNFTFHSTWGLFSPDRIDDGSRLLMENLEVQGDETAIDLGCGYGAMGVPLAKQLSHGLVHLVDKDFVAVEYAKKNAAVNQVSNVSAYLSNGFSQVPAGTKFDLIVSNLPAKVGRELYDVFFHDAKKHLKPGGRIVVVTITGLRETIKKSFKEVFGNYEKVKDNSVYVVSMAVVRS